ncbi:site-specific integrase [Roseomonas sp. OT10]|uniref:tyrosine-type recombinase/integrase n=1 Tax=Roseomonas cutis TaxID=2897332 RepID=UPI001E533EDB|nr:site-specific integrase [Roseomonas sp. OT10]UFN49260.1 site-specific integrase [Roseomonas sp. OT10]
MPLATVFARYYEKHAQHIVGAGNQRGNLRVMLETLPMGITVAELNLEAQQTAVAALRKRYAPGTVKRMLGATKAAVTWAWKNGELDRQMPFLSLPEGEGRDRVLSIAELAALWSAEMPDHVRMFLLLLIGTAGRPKAVLELTRFQCDLDRRTINLNPPGRVQTKKRRPILPMAGFLRPWIEAVPAGPLVAYRGQAVKKINGAFQAARDLAGLDAEVVPYAIRHTIATEMRARGVPEMELAGFLGHLMPNIRTTGRYTHVAPDHLAHARRAVEEIANDIDRAGTRPMVLNNLRASCVPVPQRTDCNPTAKPLQTGAAVATGIQPALVFVRRVSPAESVRLR